MKILILFDMKQRWWWVEWTKHWKKIWLKNMVTQTQENDIEVLKMFYRKTHSTDENTS